MYNIAYYLKLTVIDGLRRCLGFCKKISVSKMLKQEKEISVLTKHT